MNKKILIIFNFLILSICVGPVFSYMENYPPHRFKDGPFRHLKAEPIIGYLVEDKPYEFKKGSIFAKIESSEDGVYFLLKDGDLVLKEKRGFVPFTDYVYWVDLNNDGLKDFIVIYNYRGAGLAAVNDAVEIYLKRSNGTYQRISYDNMSTGIEDFVDINNDKIYEVIITSLYGGETRGKYHNYIAYSIYEFSGDKLVNANAKYKGFPKFVLMMDEPNDKDATQLSPKEKQEHIAKIDESITYKIITR